MSNQSTIGVQPGENIDGVINEKKELRDLNTRLQDYLNRSKQTNREVTQLKAVISQTEIEWRKKLKEAEASYDIAKAKLREENVQLTYQNQHHLEQFSQMKIENDEIKKRLDIAESQITKYCAETESLRKANLMLKQDFDCSVEQNVKLEMQYKNFAEEKESLNKQINLLNDRKTELLKEKTKQASEFRAEIDYYTRLLQQKQNEINKLETQNKDLTTNNEAIQSRLRTEFDEKLKDFVTKRETQYEQEKEEWMRIFKEEFNGKLRSYKESNKELSHTLKKKEEEIESIRERLSSLQKSKTELEVTNRNLEEEIDKLRNDIDALRVNKDDEIRNKEQKTIELREKLKKKENDYDELYSLKIQLTQEIELYRKILNEAEKEAGYSSPCTESSGGPRKKRKLTLGENSCYPTPGIARAAQRARVDITRIQNNQNNNDQNNNNNNSDDNNNDQNNNDQHNNNKNNENEIKEKENHKNNNSNNNNNYLNNDNDNDDNDNDNNNHHVTPGEAFPLQFSTMDLGKSMLELQNISENSVCLKGFLITNKNNSARFYLPDDRILQPNEKVRIIIGLRAKARQNEILWKADVWSGDELDIARLYDPQHKEIARIEFHPDMLPHQDRSCLIM